jgi:hypothetical protein
VVPRPAHVPIAGAPYSGSDVLAYGAIPHVIRRSFCVCVRPDDGLRRRDNPYARDVGGYDGNLDRLTPGRYIKHDDRFAAGDSLHGEPDREAPPPRQMTIQLTDSR